MKIRIYRNPTKKIEENENSATSYRVDRGGCWFVLARGARVSFRGSVHPVGEDGTLGFRIAKNESKK